MRVLVPAAFFLSVVILVAAFPGSPARRRGRRPSPEASSGDRGKGGGAIEGLLTRAGHAGEVSVRSVEITRGVGMLLLPLVFLPVAGLLPGRIGLLVVAGLAALGFLAPNLVLERAARKRRERIVSCLPDALDLLAVQVGAGRGLGLALADLARSGKGPLAFELGIVADEMARGTSQSVALEGLRHRTAAREVAALCTTVERSRLLGSPLADELRRQASTARVEQGRALSERAARAAPKIQLVIALVLVPAVMLLVVAALVANSDRLIGFAFG